VHRQGAREANPRIFVARHRRTLYRLYFVAGQRLAFSRPGTFAVGLFFWTMFGTLIVGRLMTEQRLSTASNRTPQRWVDA
jgi:hypothetical protein